MRGTRFLMLVAVHLGTVAVSIGQVTERVSVSSAGDEATQASYDAAISADGRFVAFASEADNLVDDDTNGAEDVFLHDRLTGATTRVSVSTTGSGRF